MTSSRPVIDLTKEDSGSSNISAPKRPVKRARVASKRSQSNAATTDVTTLPNGQSPQLMSARGGRKANMARHAGKAVIAEPTATSPEAMLREQLKNLQDQLSSAETHVNALQERLDAAIENRSKLNMRLKEGQARLAALVDDALDWQKQRAWDKRLEAAARDVFGIHSFRPLQREALNATLARRDVFAIMPTGSGKSLLYQLAAVVDRGITLVVSPLVALSADQKDSLTRLGITAEVLDSYSPKEVSKRIFTELLPPASRIQVSARPKQPRLRAGDASYGKSSDCLTSIEEQWHEDDMPPAIIFVTPERVVRSKQLLSRLEIAYEAGHLSRIAIDEAHCCSQWGHDFRPDYAKIGVLRRQLPETPIILLTATASPRVLDDVKQIVGVPRCVVFRSSIDRPNLTYEVRMRESEDSASLGEQVAQIIMDEFKGQSGIVYVLSRRECMELAVELRSLKIGADCYHGDMNAEERSSVYNRWSSGMVRVIVATIAFGLGIDNQRVRFVLHATMASSLEGYYQESGRAGRDGQPARCIVLFRPQDFMRLSTFVADKGPKRLEMMYDMCRYVMARGRGRRRRTNGEEIVCRRAMLAASFGENVPAREECASDGESVNGAQETAPFQRLRECCDLCQRFADGGGTASETVVTLDVTPEAQSALRIIEYYTKRYADEKVTLNMIAADWCNTGPKGKRLRGDQPPLPKAFDKDTRLLMLISLVLDGALREYHNYNAYSINAYVALGDTAPLALEGKVSFEIAVPRCIAEAIVRSRQKKASNKPRR